MLTLWWRNNDTYKGDVKMETKKRIRLREGLTEAISLSICEHTVGSEILVADVADDVLEYLDEQGIVLKRQGMWVVDGSPELYAVEPLVEE